MALSETHLAEVGVIKEVGAGFTFFWSGRKREMHESGVGCAIITGPSGKLSELPNGIDRPVTLTPPLSGNQHASIISAYAIAMTSQMKSTISSTMIWIAFFLQHPRDKLILLSQNWHKLPGLGWSDRISGHRHMQQLWSAAPTKTCRSPI